MWFWHENIQKVFVFAQNIWKILSFYENYSKSIVFVHKTFEKNVISSLKHSESIWFWPRIFEKYGPSTQTSEKDLISIQKMAKDIYSNTWKVSYLDLKHLELSWSHFKEVWEKVNCFDQTVLNNSATVECFRIFSRGSS